MTSDSATKRAARAYAQQHRVSYRTALQAVRRQNSDRYRSIAIRVLIEAIEGCGIRHWAGVDHWDGWTNAVITDLGGESFEVNLDTITSALSDYLDEHPDCAPLDIDGYVADQLVQQALFGLVIYRSNVTHRPKTTHSRLAGS